MNRDLLQRLFRRDAVKPPPPGHRERLEEQLLRRFDAQAPSSAPVRAMPWLRYAAPIAILVSVFTASRVPAEYLVEVGKRITLRVPAGAPMPPPQFGHKVAETVRGENGRMVDMKFTLRRDAQGGATMVIDVWGDHLASDRSVETRLLALPELSGLSAQVEELRGRVRDSLLDKMGHALFRVGTSPEERARAREQLIAELRAAEGPDAQVDVQVDEVGDGGAVRFRVQKRKTE